MSESGRAAVERLAAAAASRGARPAGVWHSGKLRAKQTAEAFWRACNGSRTVAQAAANAGVPVEVAAAFLAELTGPNTQAVQLRDRPVTRRDPSLERLVAPPRGANARPADQYGEDGETTLGHYHRAGITDGATHFDDRETTIAHAFADHGVSVGELVQTINDGTGRATLVIGTHEARESALAETVRALADSPVVTSVASVIRVEGAE